MKMATSFHCLSPCHLLKPTSLLQPRRMELGSVVGSLAEVGVDLVGEAVIQAAQVGIAAVVMVEEVETDAA